MSSWTVQQPLDSTVTVSLCRILDLANEILLSVLQLSTVKLNMHIVVTIDARGSDVVRQKPHYIRFQPVEGPQRTEEAKHSNNGWPGVNMATLFVYSSHSYNSIAVNRSTVYDEYGCKLSGTVGTFF